MLLFGNLVGIIGVLIINISYFMLSAGKIKAEQFSYAFSNFAGALLIVISLIIDWNLSAFLMECSWMFISAYGAIKALKTKS